MRSAWILFVLPLLAGSSAERPTPRPETPTKKFRLELHVPAQPGTYYSAWGDTPVIAGHDGSDGKTVTYTRRYVWADECTWEANETLVPTDAEHYRYTYREQPVSCPDGATAATYATTPRDGTVSVQPADASAPITPLVAWMRGFGPPGPAN